MVGASIAGLMTARVLSEYFDQVVAIDRDEIEDRPVVHKSVPQGHHLHAFLQGGLNVVSSLYPSITEELRRLGATRIAMGRNAVWYTPNGKAYNFTGSVRTPFDSGLEGYCASRGLLEFVIRRRTAANSNIHFEYGTAVTELICRDATVVGVRTLDSRSIEADLVVDATGRATGLGNGSRRSDFPRRRKLKLAWTQLIARRTSADPNPSPANPLYLLLVQRLTSPVEGT